MAETQLFAELPARARTAQRLPGALLAAMLSAVTLAPAVTMAEGGAALIAAALLGAATAQAFSRSH